jgi:uncharacterized membrane protein
MKKVLITLLLMLCITSSTVFATTLTRTYTIQDKLFKPRTYGQAAKVLLYTSTGRVIYYFGEGEDKDVAKFYFSIKIGGRYTFTLDKDEIQLVEGL